jgi:hypothetical protein
MAMGAALKLRQRCTGCAMCWPWSCCARPMRSSSGVRCAAVRPSKRVHERVRALVPPRTGDRAPRPTSALAAALAPAPSIPDPLPEVTHDRTATMTPAASRACVRPRGDDAALPWMGAGSRAAHAHEQPRSRGGRASGRSGGVRRHRRAARSWEAFDAIVRTLRNARRRRDAARAERQAGGGVPHARRCAARADCQRNLVGRWATWDEFRGSSVGAHDVRPDDRRLVDLHRLAGHRAGHLRDVRRGGGPALRRHARRAPGGHRRPRRHGRRAAAGRHDARGGRAGGGGRSHAHREAPRDRLLRSHGHRSRRGADAGCARRRRRYGASRWRCSATRPMCCPRSCARGITPDVVTDQTSAHDLLVGYIPHGSRSSEAAAMRATMTDLYTIACHGERSWARAAMRAMQDRRCGGLRLRQQHPHRRVRRRARRCVPHSRLRAGVHPSALLRGEGAVPLGGAVGRSGRHPPHRCPAARDVPGRCTSARWIDAGPGAHPLSGIAGAHLLAGAGSARALRVALNELVARGECRRRS